ncbi:MAG: hypothetical protein PHV24_09050 [Candidatus Kapabacteria bacterium]|nr:hypothetical protein [Candidatus Kapabacteria bacterium]
MEKSENMPQSRERKDYELLLRKRGTFEYAAYCPQLNYIIKGKEHAEVKDKMEQYINDYIEQLAAKA